MKQILLSLLLLFAVILFGVTFSSFTGKKTVQNFQLALGTEKNLSLLSKGIQWTPDGHITYVTFPDGVRRYFIAGNQKTYTIDVNSKDSPTLAGNILNNTLQIKANFGPDPSVYYRDNYSTIDSVIQTQSSNPKHLIAFTQNEEQLRKPDGTYDYSNFTSSIGLLESYDGGNTWKDLGPVIKGDDYLPPGARISGAGEPSAIINNGYVYIYFVDWPAHVNVQHLDQLYVARTKIFPDGGLGAFEFYTTSGFQKDESNLQPVIAVPENDGQKYASLPSVSYNKYLNQYLAIYQTDEGFFQAVSSDGVNWTNQKEILPFTKPLSQRVTGDLWISYPTFLSDGSDPSDQTTDMTGNLYYGSGVWPDTPHQLNVKAIQVN